MIVALFIISGVLAVFALTNFSQGVNLLDRVEKLERQVAENERCISVFAEILKDQGLPLDMALKLEFAKRKYNANTDPALRRFEERLRRSR